MEKKKQRKINYILKVLDLVKKEEPIFDTRNSFLYKIEKELKNMNLEEIYEFLMQLVSVKRDGKIVKEITDFLYFNQAVYGLRYKEEIGKKYEDKNFVQLAIEQNYNENIIKNLLKFCSNSLINSHDFNGNTIFHTIVNKKDYNLYELLIFESIEIDEELKNNDGYTYIELAKNLIELDKPFNALRIEKYKQEEEDLKNIICDYYYRHFDKFLNMLTDNVEENKKLIEDNLEFYLDNIKIDFISKDKYSTDLLLFKCSEQYRFYDINDLFLKIKALIDTGIPDVTKELNGNNFASYAVKDSIDLNYARDLALLVDEEHRDMICYGVLKKVIKLKYYPLYELYNYFCKRGFNLLNCDIRITDISRMKECFLPEAKYPEDIENFIIELHNAYQIKIINDVLKNLNYDKFIKSCRDFSGKMIYQEAFTTGQVNFIVSKIIENRENAIYAGEEINPQEVLSIIETYKSEIEKIDLFILSDTETKSGKELVKAWIRERENMW